MPKVGAATTRKMQSNARPAAHALVEFVPAATTRQQSRHDLADTPWLQAEP
jgi:hypothetical protein